MLAGVIVRVIVNVGVDVDVGVDDGMRVRESHCMNCMSCMVYWSISWIIVDML